MRHKFLGIVVVLMITAMATGAWAKAITVEEEDLAVLAGQAGGHFHKARENFLKGYIAAAADEIRVGNAYMKLEHARATGEGKKILKASIDELAELANKVEMNTVEDAIALD